MTLAIIDATHRSADDSADGISASRYAMALANVPLISHVVSAVAASGVDRVRLIAAPGEGPALRDALDSGADAGLPLTVVDAPEPSTSRALLAEIDAGLASDPVLLAIGDSLHPTLLADMHARFSAGDVDLVLSASTPGADAGRGAAERLSDDAIMLGPRTRSIVARAIGAAEQRDGLVGALLQSDLRVVVCDGDGGWAYDNSTSTLLRGNRRMLDELPIAPIPESLAQTNQVDGRVRFGRDVLASGCIIHGPVAIADGAVLEDSYVGPFTAIGAGAAISGAELEDSIVLAEAVVRHPGQRITASIIGERVRVERSFSLPRSLGLRLGSGSMVHFG